MYKFENILNYVSERKGLDFSGFRVEMLERRIQKRLHSTGCIDLETYFKFLCDKQEEVNNLVDVLTINVSHFFRDSFSFDYLNKFVLPELILKKINSNDKIVRIWSAGCSTGEEPYSIAILLNELLVKEGVNMHLNIFATDIDENALLQAKRGIYDSDALKNVKLGILKKYFIGHEHVFEIKPEIKKMVQFSYYNLLDKRSYVPNESIYGNFDIVFCRNVLIYFNPEYQQKIFNKLHKSLVDSGVLMLGESETPGAAFTIKFRRINNCCKIYRKAGF